MLDANFWTHNWISILSIVGLGILSIFNLVDRVSNTRRTEIDKADDRLMGIMQATVEQLQKKVDLAATDLVTTQSRLTSLETENKVIKDIFQGRDETMQTFMKQGFAAMAEMPKIAGIIATTNENVSKLYDLMHQLILQISMNPQKVDQTKKTS